MEMQSKVPSERVCVQGPGEVNSNGQFVLYWMISARRSRHNFSLERAVEWSRELGKPLVILEALRSGYRWASDRLHAFVIQGMAENQRQFSKKRVTYYPYLETENGQGRGLLAALAKQSCVVISDDFPCFFLPRMIMAAAKQIPCRFELVDTNGVFPMRSTDRVFSRAYDFRRFLQKNLLPHLAEFPTADPLRNSKLPVLNSIDSAITQRWPAAEPAKLVSDLTGLSRFDIDHSVGVSSIEGGSKAAQTRLTAFIEEHLPLYGQSRNEPERDVASGLSPYLHFGHISAHDVFDRICRSEQWTPDQVSEITKGSSRGWWNMSDAAESFLDELITWREVGYNMCALRNDFEQFDSLPDWARKTLEEHESDPREHLYELGQFESASTHDSLWNAAQWQLVSTGKMHNYLRMLWGKKILEWSPTPRDALDVMLELNNKYALDGRNPNSYSGIFWVLGRYDRAWGPERPVFGKIRFMSSANTARKLKVKRYIQQFTPGREGEPLLF